MKFETGQRLLILAMILAVSGILVLITGLIMPEIINPYTTYKYGFAVIVVCMVLYCIVLFSKEKE